MKSAFSFLSLLPITFAAGCQHPAKPAPSATLPATAQTTSQTPVFPYGNETYTLSGLRAQNEEISSGVRRPETTVLVSFFNNGRLSCMQHCYVFRSGESGMVRFVYNWATQSGGPRTGNPDVSMPETQRAALDEAIRNLPPAQPFEHDADAFIISWDDAGTWRTKIYNRRSLPPEVLDLCKLVDVPPTWF